MEELTFCHSSEHYGRKWKTGLVGMKLDEEQIGVIWPLWHSSVTYYIITLCMARDHNALDWRILTLIHRALEVPLSTGLSITSHIPFPLFSSLQARNPRSHYVTQVCRQLMSLLHQPPKCPKCSCVPHLVLDMSYVLYPNTFTDVRPFLEYVDILFVYH